MAGVPYVGADARSARLAWDKPSAKAVLRAAGITTPDWVVLPQERFSELGAKAVLDRIVERLRPAADGQAGAGRFRPRRRRWCTTRLRCPTAMVSCFAYHPTALVEPYVSGTNAAVAVARPR